MRESKEIIINGITLKEILKEHINWLNFTNGKRADLSGADLSDASLRGADLRGADYESIQCPEEGTFIAFKKLKDGLIAKLEIPADAKRSSATSRKCRASKAKVLAIYDGEKEVNEGFSAYDNGFKYIVGETIEPTEPFDENRWNECTSGIHFFVTRKEAEDY